MLTTGSLNIFDLFILDAGIFWHKKVRTQIAFGLNLAEREGFEPSIQFYPYTRLAGERLRPSRPPLRGNDVQCVVSWILLAILPVPVNRFFDFIVPGDQSKMPGSSTMIE